MWLSIEMWSERWQNKKHGFVLPAGLPSGYVKIAIEIGDL
jgi:hypothetical protein